MTLFCPRISNNTEKAEENIGRNFVKSNEDKDV